MACVYYRSATVYMLIVGIIWGVYGVWILIISWYYGTYYGFTGPSGIIYLSREDQCTLSPGNALWQQGNFLLGFGIVLALFMFGLCAMGIVIFVKDKTLGFVWMLWVARVILWLGYALSCFLIIIHILLNIYLAFSLSAAERIPSAPEYTTIMFGPIIVFFFWIAIAITY